jgi:hypothetical protein
LVVDRTTLELIGDGRVRQLIQVSRDGGQERVVTFEGFYVR